MDQQYHRFGKMIWRFGTLLFLAIVGAQISHWAYDRYSPTDTYNFELLTPIVQPGGELRIKFDIRRYKDSCYIKSQRILVDSDRARYAAPPREFDLAPGPIGNDHYTVSMIVPPTMAQGDAEYLQINSYQCNPIHWLFPIRVNSDPVKFKIDGPPIKGPTMLQIPIPPPPEAVPG